MSDHYDIYHSRPILYGRMAKWCNYDNLKNRNNPSLTEANIQNLDTIDHHALVRD